MITEAIYVVDDDASMRGALANLLRSVGRTATMFGSAAEFLAHQRGDAASCLVLDVRMPGQNGLDFHDEMIRRAILMPVIFITGHGDIPMAVRAMKAGAIEFLTKPFRDQDLLDAIEQALRRDQARRASDQLLSGVRERYQTLTSREREIMSLVTSGQQNKQIAGRLDLSEITIKVHRGQCMRKMEARTLADLVRMADALGLERE